MSRHAKALKYALDILKEKYGDKIKSLYLYGSCARGEQQYDSDVDILVVSDTLTKKEIHQMKLDVISDDYTLPEVELKITDGQISDKWFQENIKKDGILLWEKEKCCCLAAFFYDNINIISYLLFKKILTYIIRRKCI